MPLSPRTAINNYHGGYKLRTTTAKCPSDLLFDTEKETCRYKYFYLIGHLPLALKKTTH